MAVIKYSEGVESITGKFASEQYRVLPNGTAVVQEWRTSTHRGSDGNRPYWLWAKAEDMWREISEALRRQWIRIFGDREAARHHFITMVSNRKTYFEVWDPSAPFHTREIRPKPGNMMYYNATDHTLEWIDQPYVDSLRERILGNIQYGLVQVKNDIYDIANRIMFAASTAVIIDLIAGGMWLAYTPKYVWRSSAFLWLIMEISWPEFETRHRTPILIEA